MTDSAPNRYAETLEQIRADGLFKAERIITSPQDSAITLHVLYVQGSPAGYYELKLGQDGAVEIAYFGLLPEYIGRGLGKGLLSDAIRSAWARGASRVWLHTCTLDDPAAMPNYLKRGFKPFKDEKYETTI